MTNKRVVQSIVIEKLNDQLWISNNQQKAGETGRWQQKAQLTGSLYYSFDLQYAQSKRRG